MTKATEDKSTAVNAVDGDFQNWMFQIIETLYVDVYSLSKHFSFFLKKKRGSVRYPIDICCLIFF